MLCLALRMSGALQVAATLSSIVLGSAALFAYHCAQGQIWLAGLHPPLMYALLILLLLPVPLRFLFQVGSLPHTLFRLWHWSLLLPFGVHLLGRQLNNAGSAVLALQLQLSRYISHEPLLGIEQKWGTHEISLCAGKQAILCKDAVPGGDAGQGGHMVGLFAGRYPDVPGKGAVRLRARAVSHDGRPGHGTSCFTAGAAPVTEYAWT